MFRLQAQAETPSKAPGAPRTSPADYDFLEQKHLASAVVRYVFHDPFFYLFIDYKHKHTATGAELHALHLRSVIFFLFIYRLQAQAELTPSMCEIF